MRRQVMSRMTITLYRSWRESGDYRSPDQLLLARRISIDTENHKRIVRGDNFDSRVRRHALKACNNRITALVLHLTSRQCMHARVSAPECINFGQAQRQRPPRLKAGGNLAAFTPGVDAVGIRQRARRLSDSECCRRCAEPQWYPAPPAQAAHAVRVRFHLVVIVNPRQEPRQRRFVSLDR